MAFPTFIPKSVVVWTIAAKVHIKPILIGAVPFFGQYILESPESPAHMVEHPVQHYTDPLIMKGLAHLGQIRIGAQPGIHLAVIPGIVAMGVAFKHRAKIYRVGSQCLNVLYPA